MTVDVVHELSVQLGLLDANHFESVFTDNLPQFGHWQAITRVHIDFAFFRLSVIDEEVEVEVTD